MKGWWDTLTDSDFFVDLQRRVAAGERSLSISGLVPGARALLLSRLGHAIETPLMIVVPDDAAAEAFRRDIAALATLDGSDPSRVVTFPALDIDPYASIPPHPEVLRERVVALGQIQQEQVDLLLVPVRALMQWLPGAEEWQSWTRTIEVGDDLTPDRFVLDAMSLGYRRVDTVGAPAEVSRRGGIIDIFPPTAAEPVRIELFGDSVESLRSFDTDNQRSTGELERVVVGPAAENPATDSALRRLSKYLEAGRDAAEGDEALVRRIRARLDHVQQQGYFPGMESLTRLTVARPTTLFEFTGRMPTVVDDPERTDDELIRADHEYRMEYEESDERVLPPPSELFADVREIRKQLAQATLDLHELAGPGHTWDVRCRSARAYSGRIPELVTDLQSARQNAHRTLCVMRGEGGAKRLREIFEEYEIASSRMSDQPVPGAGGLFVGVAGLRSGFEFPDLGLTILSERDIFGEERKSESRKSRNRAAFIADFRDLKPGDVVVHVDHGVATYTGLGRPRGGSLNRDFMILEFAGGDKLFVPADRLDLVQRYSGVAGTKPKLDKLGGPGWERVKSRVRKSVRSMAKELLELYARRAATTGYAFSPDTEWQSELEAGFPYDLTPDQQRVLGEVKEEMESERVMDRLLVGDVGFGKTEIALRAAFKAVMDHKQVALLAPTTVLAFQHFNTLTQRYAPFPVRVEMVSRFRSAAETKQVLEDTASGQVDILIGTHRMLSKDVAFKQLGLLLVDEEQRFGVRHKERLKQIAVGVDVLSMTATPIPRTLQMSLAGVRDLSVIESPPPGRMAIQTFILPFRKSVLAQAIRQELRRGGQTFVVHNRVDTLPSMVQKIQEMAPDARIVMGHGQLPEKELERVMLTFVRGEADILVTTTIIENGLDIPRANTMIVNRADRFGLGQLYQLRGRIGRSSEHAYAYFVVPDMNTVSSDARKRLKALQEFSELGSGFRLAAADLEIRGAGELLGSRQHGHIAALGFDMYCQLLERAVQESRGEPVVERRPPSVHLGVDIKVPESYLPDSGDRLAIYKRLAQATTADEIDRLQAGTEDRFGHLPEAAENLFRMGRLRLAAEAIGVKNMDLVEGTLQLRFHELPQLDPEHVMSILDAHGGTLTPSGVISVPLSGAGAQRIERAAELLRVLVHTED